MKDIIFKIGMVLVVMQYVLLGLMGYNLFHNPINTAAKPTAVVIVNPEVSDTLDEKSILTPIEECSDNLRACRWAQGEREELSVLRYTQTKDNLTSNRSAIVATIDEVRNMMTLVPNDNRVSNLVYRTFTHESLLGTIDFTNANGQGIGQLTLKHAKDILKRLSKRSPENFRIISELSEIDNLLSLSDKEMLRELHTNLKLQVALCITTYWFKDPMFWQKAGDLESDAKLWKDLYNTKLGKGTEAAFIKSCKAHI